MLYLLQTTGLLAAAGIILPVVIHMWNKKEGKTLRIGSVKLLLETARQQARSFRLKNLLLLLLRCSLIALLAILLAQPVWQKLLTTKDKKGWVVLETPINEAYTTNKSYIDSLVLAGCEVHLFKTGFPLVELRDSEVLKSTPDTLTYWALIKALNEQVPDDLPVYLFTGNRLNRFAGNRPSVNMNLHWNTFTTNDSATNNLVAARLLETDSIETIVAHSTAAYTAYAKENLMASSTSNAYKTDTGTMRIGIIREPADVDENYLQAALNTIRQFGHYRMQIEVTTDPNQLLSKYDWVFWLSGKEIPATLTAKNIFRYESGKEMFLSSWIENVTGNENSRPDLALAKMIMSDRKVAGEAVWRNGYGAVVLTKEAGEKLIYHFYSRFDPTWNGLVWSERFPQLLFEIILKSKALRNPKDNRVIAVSQMQPEKAIVGPGTAKPKFIQTTDLSKWAWAAAFLLFLLERLIVLNPKKQVYD